MATKLSEKSMARKIKYDREYAKNFFKVKTVTFNTLYPEDIELFDWIKSQSENATKYVKRLIREDMERQTGAKKEDV